MQAQSANLSAIAALAVTDSNFIVGNGATWVAETGATARTSLGLGTGNSPQFAGVNIGNASDTTITRTAAGTIAVEGNVIYRAGGTDVPVADGGTGASDASGARTNLGLVIGTNVQAWDAVLDTWATKTAQSGAVVGTTNTQTLSGKTLAGATMSGELDMDEQNLQLNTDDTSIQSNTAGEIKFRSAGTIKVTMQATRMELVDVGVGGTNTYDLDLNGQKLYLDRGRTAYLDGFNGVYILAF